MTRANKKQHDTAMKQIAHVTKPRISKKIKKASKSDSETKSSENEQSASEEMRRTIIMGHRGGNFGPDNSMKNFRGSVENKLEGIEFDVSHTK